MFCMVFAYTDRGLKQVKIHNVFFRRFSLRWGYGMMSMREAHDAVRWAHKHDWDTEVVKYG